MLFLISWLIALYFLAPSAVSCHPFFSALRSSQRSSMLVVTHGLLTALRLPKISLADSVNALLKEFTSVSTSVFINSPLTFPWSASSKPIPWRKNSSTTTLSRPDIELLISRTRHNKGSKLFPNYSLDPPHNFFKKNYYLSSLDKTPREYTNFDFKGVLTCLKHF